MRWLFCLWELTLQYHLKTRYSIHWYNIYVSNCVFAFCIDIIKVGKVLQRATDSFSKILVAHKHPQTFHASLGSGFNLNRYHPLLFYQQAQWNSSTIAANKKVHGANQDSNISVFRDRQTVQPQPIY